MVSSVTSLSSNGLRDWVIQRVSAVVLGLYTLFIFGYFLLHTGVTFHEWQQLFHHPLMRTFTFLALLSLLAHAWIGMWTVFTDYVKPYSVRLVLQVLMILALISYFAWGTSLLL